jgi:hypothetical protein
MPRHFGEGASGGDFGDWATNACAQNGWALESMIRPAAATGFLVNPVAKAWLSITCTCTLKDCMQENAFFVATDKEPLAACTALCCIGVGKQSIWARRRTSRLFKWKVGRSLEEALRNGVHSQRDSSSRCTLAQVHGFNGFILWTGGSSKWMHFPEGCYGASLERRWPIMPWVRAMYSAVR